MARIRAALRGGPRRARGRRTRTGRPARSPPPYAWPGPPRDPRQLQSPPPANPEPLVFPPGSGVRFTIGRTRDCDLCLTDLSVSRMHALLVRREDGWVLSDLGSHNGTRLNGWLVREPVQVRAGDRVEFGSMAFIIQDDPPRRRRPPARKRQRDQAWPIGALRVKGAEPARVGKRDNGSSGPARAHRDDRSRADRVDARHPARRSRPGPGGGPGGQAGPASARRHRQQPAGTLPADRGGDRGDQGRPAGHHRGPGRGVPLRGLDRPAAEEAGARAALARGAGPPERGDVPRAGRRVHAGHAAPGGGRGQGLECQARKGRYLSHLLARRCHQGHRRR